MSGTYADLEVWRAAMDLAEDVYRITEAFPKQETYGLTSQIRRAAVSIPSNIAEGKGRSSERELIQFLCRSRGSLFELETQSALALRLGYVTRERHQQLMCRISRVGQLLNGLIRAFRPPLKI